MCGFVAIFKADNQSTELTLAEELLNHRGPDDKSIITDENYVLGFWRLSIVDIDNGRQPMEDKQSRVKVLFNGEVYNYQSIRNDLQRKNYEFKTSSDTEVVLKSYLEWGINCFDRFEGMFSVCIIDSRKNRIFLARDRMGVKPLYYSFYKSDLIIASEQKAILKTAQFDASINKNALIDYFLYQAVLGSETLFKDIFKVPNGKVLTFDKTTHELLNEQNIGSNNTSLKFTDYHEYREFIREAILEQTYNALNTDLEVSFQLSGGIDSNLMLGIANHFFPEKKKFTVSSTIKDNFDDNELHYIKKTVDGSDYTHNIIEIDSNNFFENLEDTIEFLDEPVGDAGVVAQSIVNKAISKYSKIGIAGQGADELFFGYMRNFLTFIYSTDNDRLKKSPFFDGWADYRQTFESGKFKKYEEAYFNKMARFSLHEKADSNARLFYEKLNLKKIDDFKRIYEGSDSLNSFMVNTEIQCQLPSLLQMEDRASMKYSVETRVPLCTASILDSSYLGSIEWKFKNDMPKGILRDAFSDIIPDHILSREKKVGRPIPLKKWLGEKKGKKYYSLLESNKDQINDLFDFNILDYSINHPNPYDRTTWAILSLLIWARKYRVSL